MPSLMKLTLKVIYFKIIRLSVSNQNLILEWVEAEDTFALSTVSTIQEAVNSILKFLALGPSQNTETVPEGTHTHTLLCSGTFKNGADILLKAKLALADGVTMNLIVKTTEPDVADLVISAIG